MRLAVRTLTIGSDDLVSLAGTYDTAQDFVDAINSKVCGAYASLDDTGQLQLSSTERSVTAAGAGATALGVTAGERFRVRSATSPR